MRRSLVLLLAIGCFHNPPPPPPAPAPQHTCATAAAKLAEILIAKKHATAEAAKPFEAAVEKACTDDRWPAVAIECVDNAPNHDALLQCGRDHLTDAQMQSVERAAKAVHREEGVQTGGALTVTALEPDKGDADGGTYVRITGSNFLAEGARNVKVYFGSVQGTVVRFASDTELIVQAPGGKAGEQVDVVVMFEPGGELKIPKAFTFVTKP